MELDLRLIRYSNGYITAGISNKKPPQPSEAGGHERSTVDREPMSVVEERHAVGDGVDVFNQPVVELAAHARRELADEAERDGGREDRVVQQHQLEVAEPLDAPELA